MYASCATYQWITIRTTNLLVGTKVLVEKFNPLVFRNRFRSKASNEKNQQQQQLQKTWIKVIEADKREQRRLKLQVPTKFCCSPSVEVVKN